MGHLMGDQKNWIKLNMLVRQMQLCAVYASSGDFKLLSNGVGRLTVSIGTYKIIWELGGALVCINAQNRSPEVLQEFNLVNTY